MTRGLRPSAGWHRFRHEAMATEFELVLQSNDAEYAKQGAREAWKLIDQLENELSRYRYGSDVSRLNSAPPGQPVRIGLASAYCLSAAMLISELTSGAFDVCAGPLIDLWKSADGPPSSDAIRQAQALCGVFALRIDTKQHMAAVTREGVRIDLGAIGKGFAVDAAVTLLHDDWEFASGVLHSGESSARAWGSGPDSETDGWLLEMKDPARGGESLGYRLRLVNESVSGSGLYHKGSHIVDPRTGQPAPVSDATWVVAPETVFSDALSTAAMLLEDDELMKLLPEFNGTTFIRNCGNETFKVIGSAKPEKNVS